MNELVLSLSEDAWNGDAQCRIWVDDKPASGVVTVNAKHGSGTQAVVVYADLAPGPHVVTVDFLNDGYGGKPELDRNLYFEGATIDGSPIGMMAVKLGRNGQCAPVGFTVEQRAFDMEAAFARFDAKMALRFDQLMAAVAAGGGTPPPVEYAGPMLDRLFVGPGKPFAEIADAVKWANPGAILLVDDGVYKKVFDCAVPGIVIASRSGDPFKCWCDGEGLSGGGKRGSYDKSFMHFRAPFTVVGIGGRNCGGSRSDKNHTNEAFIYAELFEAPGVAKAVRCSADNCGNGFFVPGIKNNDGTPGPGVNVHWEDEGCVMGKLAPNGQSAPDGSASHDCYLSGLSVRVKGRISLGSAGHGVKSRSLDTEITDSYLASLGGRAVEGPDGGLFVVRKSILVSRGDGNQNFVGWCDESAKNGANVAIIEDSLLVMARRPTAFHIGAGASVQLVRCEVQQVGGAYAEVLYGGALNGMPEVVEQVPELPVPPSIAYAPFTMPA